MFQLIVTPQGIEKVTIQSIDTPTKVYAIGARLLLSKVSLEVLQNWVLIQLIVTPHILENKRSVPINRTVSSNWNQRVIRLQLKKVNSLMSFDVLQCIKQG